MTRSICLSILFLSMVLPCMAQLAPNEPAYADSLVNVLRQSASDSVKANTNYLLSDYWCAKDTVRSRQYLEQGRQLGTKYPVLRALYHFYEGRLYFNLDTEKAAAAFKKAEQALSGIQHKDAYQFRSAAWYNYGIMKRNEQGDAFLIDILLNKAIPLAEKAGNVEKTAHYYSQLATLFMYNRQFDKAEVYNNKAIGLLEGKHPNSSILLLAYLAANSNYIYQLKSAQAKKMLDKAREMLQSTPESVNYPNYYYNEGLYYITKTQFDKALVSLEKGIAMAQSMHQAMLLQMLIFRKYNILLEQKAYGQAKQFLAGFLKEGSLTADANNRKTIYQQLANVSAELGQMGEAYKWLTAYNRVNDSLNEAQVKYKINALEVKHRNAEHERKIIQLEGEKKVAVLSAGNNRLLAWLLGTLCVFLLIVAAFAVFYYRSTRKLATIKAMMEGEERERERVARDLHDGLGGLLAGVRMDLSGISEKVANGIKVQDPLTAATLQLDDSINELRRIARNMMPETLFRFGLPAALKDFCEGFEKERTHITLQCYGMDNGSISPGTQVMIYRIVQELVTNALKHANASEILVDCIQHGQQINITVEDNGTGFDPGTVKGNGIGLSNIQTRVNYLNGKLDIQFAKNTGTTINIQFNEHATAAADIAFNRG